MSIDNKKGWYDVSDYGAVGDGKTNDSRAIQAAIDYCDAKGGGIVYIPAGTYICGTLVLKGNITMHISSGTTIVYSKENQDFHKPETLSYKTHADVETSYFHHALLMGEGIQNVILQGGGIIDNAFYKRPGPKPIALKHGNFITIRDLTIKNAPNYAISLLNCENITIENVKIIDAQADGIDFDNCRFGRVSNCYVESFDDAICLKTSLALGNLSNTSTIAIINCSLASSCNCFKLGTESNGDFNNIAVSNCTFFPRANARKGISGIAIETVDGGNINNITINNITIQGANCPIFLRLGYRGRGKNPPKAGILTNVLISNIVVSNATFPCVFAGIRDNAISNIILENIVIEYIEARETPREKVFGEIFLKGAKRKSGTSLFNVPEAVRNYPEADMFGSLPAWGLYGRHLKNITLRNVQLRLTPEISLKKLIPGLIFEYTNGLELDGIDLKFTSIKTDEKMESLEGKNVIIWFNQAAFANLQNYRIISPIKTEIRISGDETKALLILSPKFAQDCVVKIDPEVKIKEISQK